jgi:RNA polymerase sigma-70 factor (ECF subfamily)
MTDELLVVRSQLGERGAFTELVRAWHGPVSTYVRRMLGPGEVDDVVQDVWIGVLRGLPGLREPGRFTPWLFTIARRAVTNRLRAEYARAEGALGAEPAVADASAAVLDRAELVAGLSALPAPEREVLVLFHLLDLPLQTCAAVCGVPVGTVKSRLFRARRSLRQELSRKGRS